MLLWENLPQELPNEIQNPLNFVNNFSEISLELVEELKVERSKAKEQRDETLENELLDDLAQNQEKINHHGKRASSIVKGMLEHSRAGTGERRLTNLTGLANEYLNIAYQGLRARDKSFNIEMITDFDASLSEIEMIPQDFGRVLLNLYNNAFYATHEKALKLGSVLSTKIEVSTRIVNEKVELRIKDNGTGIPREVMNKIFQPSSQPNLLGEGTGLGLSISYDIVTKGHGGEIIVQSEEGAYTEFVVRLPF